MVMIRSSGLASARSARSIVVFPASVPPETMMFSRARTAASENPPYLFAHRVGQVRQGGIDQAVATDGDARTMGHLDHGRETVAAGEVEVDDRLGRVDPTFASRYGAPGRPAGPTRPAPRLIR